jgi:hypothetical protein
VPVNSSLDTSIMNLPLDVFAVRPLSIEEKLFISQFAGSMNYRSNIAMGDNYALSLLTVSSFQQTGIGSVGLQQSTKALIIPVVALIVIGSIISAVVLKILLDSIENELFELEHRCKFIVEGDISIEIPEYNGTKDIRQLYDQVKIINKLHRYTNSDYFSGHFAEKVLKYSECLQFINNLGYDAGNVL